jgi:hypothetical protein
MTGGSYSDFVVILCANSDDADRGAPIGSGVHHGDNMVPATFV